MASFGILRYNHLRAKTLLPAVFIKWLGIGYYVHWISPNNLFTFRFNSVYGQRRHLMDMQIFW